MAKPSPTEHQDAVALMNWAGFASGRMPALRMLFAIPNGGDRNKIIGAMMKAEGVKPGIPDYMLPHCAGGWPGLFLELKRRTGGRLAEEQRERMRELAAEGYAVALARGWFEARAALERYIAGKWTAADNLAMLAIIGGHRGA